MSRARLFHLLSWLLLGLLVLLWGGYRWGIDNIRSGPSLQESSAQAAPQSSDQVAEINITDKGFDPPQLSITVGTKVTWHNATTQTLTLSSGITTTKTNIYLPALEHGDKSAATQATDASSVNPSDNHSTNRSSDDFLVRLAPGASYQHVYTADGLQMVSILEFVNISVLIEILLSQPRAGVTGRLFAHVGTGQIFVPDIQVFLKNVVTHGESARVSTNLQGQYWFPRKAIGDYFICWEAPGFTSACTASPITIDDITVYAGPMQISPVGDVIQSKVLLADETPCRMFDMFFGLDVWTDVNLVDDENNLIRHVRANTYGEFLISDFARGQHKPLHIEASCENAKIKLDIPASNDELITESDIGVLHLPNHRPSIQAVIANLNGIAVRQAPLGSTVVVSADASDPDNDLLHFLWGVVGGSGTLSDEVASRVDWHLPTALVGDHTLYVVAGDQSGGYTTMSLDFPVGAAGVTFSGRVIDLASGTPLADAQITINGSAPVNSDALGGIYVTVPESMDGRYIFNVSKPGYALLSHVYQSSVSEGLWRLIHADVRSVDPGGQIDITDQESTLVTLFQRRGAQLSIPAKSLVNADGKPPSGPLTASFATLDAGLEPIPGDYSAIRSDNSQTSLVSYGAAFVDFRDSSGEAFNHLAIGATAAFTIPINPAQVATAPGKIPLWYYDEDAGRWRDNGEAVLQDVGGVKVYIGQVEHFSTLNLDLAFDGAATCLRFSLGNTLRNVSTLRIHVPNISGYPHGQDLAIDTRPIHAFFRLPLGATITLEPRDNQGNPIIAATRAISLTNPPYTNQPALEYPFPFAECGPIIVLDMQIPPYYTNPPGKSVFLTKEGPFSTSSTGADLGNAYYHTIAPATTIPARRTTLGEWWQSNGFDLTGNATGQVQAHYFNGNDLAFGREMHCLRRITEGTLGCYVTNYLNADDALNEHLPAATVAMEYAPVENHTPATKIVKFFIYNGGDAGAPRIPEINLDPGINANPSNPHSDPIPVPYLCIVCHGGTNNYNPVNPLAPTFDEVSLGANFREFDLETFKYPGNRDFNALVQQSIAGPDAAGANAELNALKSLNLLVRDHSGLSSALIGQLINGWYPGSSNIPDVTFVPSVAPNSWNDTPQTHDLYGQVYATTCRACHIAQNNYINFPSYDAFKNRRVAIYDVVCGPHRIMPNSRITYDNFWTSINPHRPGVLDTFSGPGWTAFSLDPSTPCPHP